MTKIELQGVGVMRAHEAINCLKRIPKNDALRARAFQIVQDWIEYNNESLDSPTESAELLKKIAELEARIETLEAK